jgi:autotransporter-associated beta strand protein
MATWGIMAHSHAQSDFTWTGANGSWTDTGNWTVSGNGTGYPDATDDAVYFSQNTTAIDISMPNDSSAVAGTITMNGNGTVRLGNATTFAGNLTLGSTSAPIFNVNSGRLAIFTELIGSQGFRKTGGGILNFNTNTLNMTNLTGNVSIEDGTVWLQQAGNFGGGNLSFSGSNTLFQLRGNLTTTFAANRNIQISTGSNINFWNFDTLSAMVFDGPITGSGNLTFTNGNFTINGANTYSGNTTVAGSGADKAVNILLGSGSNLSNGTLNFTSLGTAVINLGGNAQTIQNLVTESTNTGSSMTISNGTLSISGGGDISLGGRGGTFTLSLANLSSFTAGTASSNFTFQSGNTTGTTTNTLTLSTNGTNTITGRTVLFGRTSTGGASTGAAYSANVNLGAVNTINADIFKVGSTNATSALAFQAGLSNPSLTLRSANGTGAVGEWIIGELTAESGGRSGLGTVDLQGGTLDALVGNLTVGLNSNSTVNSVSWLKISAGNLSADTIRLANKSGSSVGALSGTIYQSGGNVSVDFLEFGQSGSGNSTITAIYELTGGRLEVGDIQVGGGNFTNTSNRTLLISGNATLTNVSGSNLTITGASNSASGLMKININGNATLLASNGDIILSSNSSLTGSGSLTKNGSGNLILSGTSSFTGATNINQGAVVLGANQNLGAIAGSGNLSLGTYTLTTNASSSTTFSGAISGSGGLTKNGTGTLTLTGELSYTGNTSINTGTVVIGSPSQLGGGIYSGNIINSGTLIYSGTSNQTLSGIISGAGVLTHNASSRLTLTGNNSYSGNTTINTGTVEIGSAGRLGGGSYSGNIANSGTLIYSGTSNQTLSGIISGAGVLTHNASSRLTLTGNNSYSGNTTITTGTLEITTTGRLGGGNYSGNITNSGQFVLGSNSNQTLSGQISGNGAITKNGTGILTLNGSNNYSGNTTINAGTVVIGNSTGLGASGNITFGGGTLQYGSGITTDISTRIKNSGSAILIHTNNNDITFAGTLDSSNSGGLTKNGTGTLTLAGNSNYSGNTTINTGTVVIGHANGAGTGRIVQTDSSSLLKFDTIGTITNNMSVYNVLASQSATLSGAITVNNATWDVENGDTITITGNVSGGGGVTKNGNGTLVLSGNNTYAAATTINAGTLNAASANALGSNNTVQVNGGTLLVSADNAINGMNITLNGTSTTIATLAFSGNYSGAVGNLTLSANSIIDLGAGSTLLSFHDIEMGIYYLKFHNWTGTTLWDGGTGNDTDRVYIISGVSNNELGKMKFYSGTTNDSFLGTGFDLGFTATSFDPGLSGYQIIPVPEPETWAVGCLLLLGGSFWMWRSGRLQKTISN